MVNEQGKKIKMIEKKERAHFKKRQMRKGKILVVLEVEVKIKDFVLFFIPYTVGIIT